MRKELIHFLLSLFRYLRSGAALFNLKNVSKALEAFTKALEMSQSIQKGSPSLQEGTKFSLFLVPLHICFFNRLFSKCTPLPHP